MRVLQSGGSRRSSLPAELAHWHVLRDARASTVAPVVGRCEACGAPMVGDGPPPLPSWTLATPGGDLVVAEGIVGPQGAMSEEDAEKWLTEQLTERVPWQPLATLFEAALFTTLGVPFLIWVFTVAVSIYFFYGLWGGWIGMPEIR